MQPAKRIVRNTGFLYGKMVITIFVSLYSTRLVLNALGIVDYGIYNLIGGIIALLSFVNSGMIVASGRYLSFYLGAGEKQKLNEVFSSSVVLHFIIGLIIVTALEIAGFFIFDGVLNIPFERIHTAKIIFQCMIVSTFFSINSVPYGASINSHENFLFEAMFGILESFIKLGIAILLITISGDKLILYAILIAAMTIIVRIIMGTYCHYKYEECRTKIRSNIKIKLLKEMLAFAGWNVFSLFCYVVRTQGLAVVLNLFFGVVVNAAYGIANQVSGTLSSFSTNMIKAFLPQIFKSGGSGNNERMLRLSMLSSKLSIYLLALFAIPLFIEMPFVLNVWLKTVPENTIIFCRLILIIGFLQQPTMGLMAAITTVGNIKVYQLVTGTFQFLNLPIAYGLIKLGLPAYFVLIGSISLEIINVYIVIWFAHKLAGLHMKNFLINTLLRALSSVALACIFALLIRFSLPEGILRTALVIIISTTSLFLFGKLIALTSEEYEKIKELFKSFYLNLRVALIKTRIN
jgi:O-antigen/teichoic acid export membrane protein